MSELLSCPFCGGDASVLRMDYGYGSTVWGVFCTNDSDDSFSHGHFIDNYATEAEAIDAWNARAERTCRMGYKGGIPEFVSLDEWTCSECGSPIYNDSEPIFCAFCGAKVVEE